MSDEKKNAEQAQTQHGAALSLREVSAEIAAADAKTKTNNNMMFSLMWAALSVFVMDLLRALGTAHLPMVFRVVLWAALLYSIVSGWLSERRANRARARLTELHRRSLAR